MVDAGAPPQPLRPAGWINRLAASPRFQAFCARVPGLSGIARREGAALFDLMQGFVQSQMLTALVELRVLHLLADGPSDAPALAARLNVPPDRMQVLLQAGAAMQLLRRRGTRYALARRGAAFIAVPGLEDMVRHHSVLYADLADPVAFVRGESDPDLARFWPYVFGATGPMDADVTARYSRLMADSQRLVAEEALAHVSLSGARRLMDVGGGTGAFLRAVRARYPALDLALFDLPDVVTQAALPADIARHGGSFRTDPLPGGADTISLVRVLYDHADDTVLALLRKVHAALPPGGRVLIVEPMSGGARPDPQTDVYFAVYTMAMQTGRTRSPAEIAELLRKAGFDRVSRPMGQRAYLARAITAQRPAQEKGAQSVNVG
ncbi:MAG: methyltransferase domain-containing protein [Rhodobacteraceae bacterium]|nr:methyltransferase domain-containing protein [Paracoccaceae bacterium]TVR47822.1 MAG: methyltransferase domain-containing protein [Paracoccaceae bacterium]